MWQVVGFAPNELRTTLAGEVTADEQGRIKTVKFATRFNKRTAHVYYPGDDGYSERLGLVIDPAIDPVEVGCWIKGDSGEICEILDIKIGIHRGAINILGYTVFGCNNFQGRKPPKLAINRTRYSSLATAKTNGTVKFTRSNRELLLAYVNTNFDPFAAYEMATGRKIQTMETKGYAKFKIKQALKSKDAQTFLMGTIREHLQKQGISPEVWAQKLLDSVPDQITTKTQLEMWELIGLLTPDVRREIMLAKGEDSGDGQAFLIPTEEPKQVTEATFKDVCDICNGTGKVKNDGREGAIDGYCSCAEGKKLQEVSSQVIGLKF